MSTPPPAPEPSRGQDLTGALVWVLGAALVAVYAFIKLPDAGRNQWFYAAAGGIAVVVALLNGYGAWVASRQKPPPAA